MSWESAKFTFSFWGRPVKKITICILRVMANLAGIVG